MCAPHASGHAVQYCTVSLQWSIAGTMLRLILLFLFFGWMRILVGVALVLPWSSQGLMLLVAFGVVNALAEAFGLERPKSDLMSLTSLQIHATRALTLILVIPKTTSETIKHVLICSWALSEIGSLPAILHPNTLTLHRGKRMPAHDTQTQCLVANNRLHSLT